MNVSSQGRRPPVRDLTEHGRERLHGDLARDGFCVEAYCVRTRRDWDWGRCFRCDAFELCLNLEGLGRVCAGQSEANFRPASAGVYFTRDNRLAATRPAEQRHLFVAVTWTREFIERTLGREDRGLVPAARAWLGGRSPGAAVGRVRSLSASERVLAESLRRPAVCEPARAVWYRAKTLELAASFFFEAGNPSPSVPGAASPPQDIVRQAISVLAENPAEPPTLVELARRVGLSPFHLSRLFSRHAGMTIPRFVQKLRVERAAELLASGSRNVTEAAVEVGYSSLSHFSKAFCEIMGCCPCLYPRAHSRRRRSTP